MLFNVLCTLKTSGSNPIHLVECAFNLAGRTLGVPELEQAVKIRTSERSPPP